ncbi:hypothetical protein JS84_09685 [Vibrio vulnificus]|nr:hypothetical protein JS83_07340 [Vibrio vulnificus]KFK64774.1 hypothetical protein JS84_09685 [Vibrio vulnificus]KFK67548.1 hypothetical protein JS85_19295 [Vibrio vulnificus]
MGDFTRLFRADVKIGDTCRWLFTQCALPTQWFEWRDYQDQSSEVAMQYGWFLIGMRTIATIYVTDN